MITLVPCDMEKYHHSRSGSESTFSMGIELSSVLGII